jgi:glycosyltransferase involved in cell wall biosynthesis
MRRTSPNVDRQMRPTPASLRTAVRFLDSREAARRMRELVRDHRPDIAHVHSINHQLTPSILRVLRDEGIPAVMTLHDYKLVCPAYTMLAGGRTCERCSGGHFFRATTSSCRGVARSAMLSAESYLQHNVLRSYRAVSLFLSPSKFLADKFRAMGFRHNVEVLANPSISAPRRRPAHIARSDHFLFAGRVTPEGSDAVRSGAEPASLKIAGDGLQLDSSASRRCGQHRVPGARGIRRRNG